MLEQMENGPVSMNLVARIKAHPMYDHRPMVNELLESIIAAQPPSVQKEISKLIQQQSQAYNLKILDLLVCWEFVRRQPSGIRPYFDKDLPDIVPSQPTIIGTTISNRAETRKDPSKFEERPWHSVEVRYFCFESIRYPT